jgi:hypothetical protein
LKNILTIKLLFVLSFFNYSFSQTTITTINSGFWTNPTTWDAGVPQNDDNIIVNHNLEIDTQAVVTDISINNITTLYDTIYIKGVLNIESDLTNGVVVLVNNDVDKGRLGTTSTGELLSEVIWQKWLERCDGWAMYGGPFELPLVDYGYFHTGVAGSLFPSFWTNTYLYDETIPDVDREIGWTAPGNVSDILPRGQAMYLFDSSTTSLTESRVIEVKGFTDLTENFNYRPKYSGANGSDENGWNLMSNPFLGTIDWDAPGWFRRRTYNAIWVLDNCTNLYSSYVNGVGVNGGTSLISSGQGFWIKARRNNPRLRSRRDVLTNTNSEIKSINQNQIIRLTLNGDEIALVINPNATTSSDTLYDAIKFITTNSTIYSELDEKYAINTFNDIGSIPIWVKGEGTLEINLAEYDTIINLMLEDVVTGDITPINNTTDYYFINTSPGFTHRFNVLFSNVTNILQYEHINRESNSTESIDILGRKVTTEKGINFKSKQ